jgi:hypothetical protein
MNGLLYIKLLKVTIVSRMLPIPKYIDINIYNIYNNIYNKIYRYRTVIINHLTQKYSFKIHNQLYISKMLSALRLCITVQLSYYT